MRGQCGQYSTRIARNQELVRTAEESEALLNYAGQLTCDAVDFWSGPSGSRRSSPSRARSTRRRRQTSVAASNRAVSPGLARRSVYSRRSGSSSATSVRSLTSTQCRSSRQNEDAGRLRCSRSPASVSCPVFAGCHCRRRPKVGFRGRRRRPATPMRLVLPCSTAGCGICDPVRSEEHDERLERSAWRSPAAGSCSRSATAFGASSL